jgi:uncharacterized phage-associated protein
MDRLKLIKLIFLADRMHLAKYGRPIVGGHYCAMPHGPVASEFYNAIKDGDLGVLPEEGSHKVATDRKADEDFLSESDLEILRYINNRYGSRDAWSLRELTHQFEAYKRNFLGGNTSYNLPYEDFFLDLEASDQEMLELVKESQEAEKALG